MKNKINCKVKNIKKLVNKLCLLLKLKGVTITVKREKLDKDEHGYMYEVSKNVYVIVINKSNDEMKETVCHEMIHVSQYETGKLTHVLSPVYGIKKLWNGKQIPNNTPYRQLPWEMEAFSMEKELVKQI